MSYPLLRFLGRLLLPPKPYDVARNALSVLSLLALFSYATQHSYSQALELIVNNYDNLIRKFLSPITPLGEMLSDWLKQSFDWQLDLQPHWRHIFVLMGVYFLSRVGSNYRAGLYATALFRLVWGLLVAFVSSVLAGSFQVPLGSYWPNAVIAFTAVAGMIAYELVINVWYASFFRKMQARLHNRATRTWLGEFLALSRDDFIRAFAAGAMVAIALLPSLVRSILLAGLVMLASVMFAYGCFWLYWAWKQESNLVGIDKMNAYWLNTDAAVGATMVSVFIWAGSTILVDTGVKVIFG